MENILLAQHSVFGIEHTLYFVVSNIVGVIALFCVIKFCKTDRQKNIALNFTAGFLLAMAMFHRFMLAFHPNAAPYGGWQYLIPSSFCSITSVAFAIAVLTIRNRNHAIFHCVMYVSFLGGAITIFYPDWLFRDGIMHPATIPALIHHTISFYLFLMMFIVGGWKPSLKKWHYAYLGLALYLLLGYFLIEIMGNYAAVGVFFEIAETIYIEGYGYHEVTLTRGRPIALDWHWSFEGLLIFGAYHFGFMGLYECLHKKNCVNCTEGAVIEGADAKEMTVAEENTLKTRKGKKSSNNVSEDAVG